MRFYPYLAKNAKDKNRLPLGLYFQMLMLVFGFFMIWTWRPTSDNKLPGFVPIQPAAPTQAFYSGSQPLATAQPKVMIDPTTTPTVEPVVIVSAVPAIIQLPSATVAPISTEIVIEMGRFSFYDPMIGVDKPDIAQINCADWSVEENNCKSNMRDGSDFRQFYFKAAACRYDLFLARAKFKILSPDWLKTLFPDGFVCLDTGEAVTGLFFDFLIPWQSMPMPYDQTPWGYPIALLRIQ